MGAPQRKVRISNQGRGRDKNAFLVCRLYWVSLFPGGRGVKQELPADQKHKIILQIFLGSIERIGWNIPGITQASILMQSCLKTGINPPPHTSAWLLGKNLHIGFPYIRQLGAKRGITMVAAILIWPYFGPDCAWICLPVAVGVSA